MTKDAAEIKDREDHIQIANMQKSLGLVNYRHEEMQERLKEHRQTLAHLFDSDRRRQKMNLADFLSSSVGQDWKSDGSMLVVLFGRNEASVSSTISHSWLSPIAVQLVESLLESHRIVAYDLCDESSTLIGVLSRLIFQLLEKNPAVLRRGKDFHNIQSQLSHTGDDRIKALYTALSRIINLQKGNVFIVLNRPDLCELGKEESPDEYIEIMLSLVRDATIDLKIMLVQRSEIWDIEKKSIHCTGKETQKVDRKRFQAVRLDQCRQ